MNSYKLLDTPFIKGSKVKCIKSTRRLVLDKIYTVAGCCKDKSGNVYVALEEIENSGNAYISKLSNPFGKELFFVSRFVLFKNPQVTKSQVTNLDYSQIENFGIF